MRCALVLCLVGVFGCGVDPEAGPNVSGDTVPAAEVAKPVTVDVDSMDLEANQAFAELRNQADAAGDKEAVGRLVAIMSEYIERSGADRDAGVAWFHAQVVGKSLKEITAGPPAD